MQVAQELGAAKESLDAKLAAQLAELQAAEARTAQLRAQNDDLSGQIAGPPLNNRRPNSVALRLAAKSRAAQTNVQQCERLALQVAWQHTHTSAVSFCLCQ